MKISQLQKKAKFVRNAEGKLTEVLLPYESYQEYLDMKISLELYESLDTQESIKKAREDLAAGRFEDYEDIEQLIKELHEGKNQDTQDRRVRKKL